MYADSKKVLEASSKLEAGLSIDQRWVSGNCWWVEGQRQVGR